MPSRKPSKKQNYKEVPRQPSIVFSGGLAGVSTTDAPAPKSTAKTAELFLEIRHQIDLRTDDPLVDKVELRNIIEMIEQEVEKGNSANPGKVERWLRFLATLSDDVFESAIAVLTSSKVDITTAIKSIAQKAKDRERAK